VRRRGTEFLAGGASGAAATHSFGRILRGGANARRGETRRGRGADPRGPADARTGGGGQFG
jgi:hypothetical protein